TAHWGLPDPAAVQGTEEEVARAFREAFMVLDRRISLLLALPTSALEQMALKQRVAEIGRS
ncbi:MAG TPA: hypothetical protein VN151_00145, partial [Terracidiphilus sp.]|nr:hypothetical protein [Terracidiphilus sp.]